MFAEDIKVWSVPHVDGLRSADFISFIVHDCNGEVYLPRNYTEYTPNRTWLANICTFYVSEPKYRKFLGLWRLSAYGKRSFVWKTEEIAWKQQSFN